MMKSINPFFIVGPPRSGTTLLATIMCRHSAIAIPPETQYFPEILPKLRSDFTMTQEKVSELLSQTRLADLNLDVSAVFSAIDSDDLTKSLFLTLLTEYARDLGATVLGEKSPSHVGYVSEILDIFPESKVVCLIRDGRAVSSSLRRLNWDHSNLYRHAASWVSRARAVRDVLQHYPQNSILVKYEDLVENPSVEVGKVCDFIGVHFEPSQLLPSDSGLVPEWERGWKAMANETISNARLESWKTDLSEPEIPLVENILSKELLSFGYELSETSDRESAKFLDLFKSYFYGSNVYFKIRSFLGVRA